MNKFLKAYKIVMQSVLYPHKGDTVPRPSFLTNSTGYREYPELVNPQNYYGSTGKNASYYDRYIQDEAEDIYIDKYGQQRGHYLWLKIIEKGKAMWKVCDNILGQLRSMSDYNNGFLRSYKQQLPETYFSTFKDYDSWIYQWTIWMLGHIISGDSLDSYGTTGIITPDVIKKCLPTFNYYANNYPEIFLPLIALVPAEYNLQQQIHSFNEKFIARQTAKAEKEAKEKEIQRQKEEQAAIILQNKQDLLRPLGEKWINRANNIDKFIDLSVGIENLLNLPIPTNKDQQRIFDIIIKSSPFNAPTLENVDIFKAEKLASQMNAKITDNFKRDSRKNAALKYGLIWIANCFTI